MAAIVIPVSKSDQTAALIKAARQLGVPMPTDGQRKTLSGS